VEVLTDLPQIYLGLLISTVAVAVAVSALTRPVVEAEIWVPPMEDQVVVVQVPRSAHVEQR
jgi:hypothetical protein